MNNAIILGLGVVGRATALSFGIKNFYDKVSDRSNTSLKEAADYKYIFICLPTPTLGGKCFTGDIENVFKELLNYGLKDSIVIIRSTVTPGFNRYLMEKFNYTRIVSNPEFLSEDTREKDALHPQLIVVGSDNTDSAKQVKGIYEARFKYSPVILTDSTTAELIKYTLNTFFATKVIFANEIFDYAQKVHANYEVVKKVLEIHPWGSKNHFKIFDKGGRGAGGKCLPKDLEAFAKDTDSDLLQEVKRINNNLLYKYPKQ